MAPEAGVSVPELDEEEDELAELPARLLSRSPETHPVAESAQQTAKNQTL